METVNQILLDIVKGITDYPDAVELKSTEQVDELGESVVINVRVAKEDVGMCIGQKGSTAEAIRRVVGLVAYKQTGKRVFVKIDAPKMPKSYYHDKDFSEVK